MAQQEERVTPRSLVDGKTGTKLWVAAPVAPAHQHFRRSPANLAAVDRCLAAACYSLGFDIAELWSFVPDPMRPPEVRAGQTVPAQTPCCLHVYAQPATMETYSARIIGIWNAEARAQQHTLSPALCDRAREGECPLWFTSRDHDTPLHEDLPLNTAVALPIRLETAHKDCVVVFFSCQDVHRDRAALDFLIHIAKATVLAASTRFPAAVSTAPWSGGPGSETGSEAEAADTLAAALAAVTMDGERRGGALSDDGGSSSSELESASAVAARPTRLNDVTAFLHPGEQVDTKVKWSELSNIDFLVNGSRCTIYTATYRSANVVVKLLRKDVHDAAVVRRELESELDLLSRIRHENIVRLVGAGSEPERFLLIERLDGGTLAQRCGHGVGVRDRRSRFKRPQPFSYVELLRCARQLAEALRHLHEEAIPGKMVIHRDLKPDNIGFSRDGDIKLLDLGLSKAIQRSEVDGELFQMTGETGSLRYMAPEVAESRPYNEKSDVHSYAMVLWEMATMHKPYEGMNRDEFYSRVVRGGARPSLNKKWPRPFCGLLESCWDEDPARRPSMAVVSSRLQEMIQEAVDHHTGPPTGRGGRKGLLGRLGIGITDRHSSWF